MESLPADAVAASDDGDILTPADLERRYKIKQGTQKALRARRQLPFLRLGGGKLIRYRVREIEAWLSSHAVPAGARGR